MIPNRSIPRMLQILNDLTFQNDSQVVFNMYSLCNILTTFIDINLSHVYAIIIGKLMVNAIK